MELLYLTDNCYLLALSYNGSRLSTVKESFIIVLNGLGPDSTVLTSSWSIPLCDLNPLRFTLTHVEQITIQDLRKSSLVV